MAVITDQKINSLEFLESESRIIDRYQRFSDQRLISDFSTNGGIVCLATEGQTASSIRLIHQEGHIHFAEKFAKELVFKKSLLTDLDQLQFHYYGSIQTNKLKKIIQNSDLIESLSNKRHAEKVAGYLKDIKTNKKVFIQVNTGREPQKLGLDPSELDPFVEYCMRLGLPIDGLMCIPPLDEDPAVHFTLLRKLADRHSLLHCQMGSSRDYSIAIDCGATCIRIGKLIFQPGFL